MASIYLDTNVIIYLVENAPSALQVRAYLQSWSAPTLCSSNLALMECLVKPLKQGNLNLRDRFLAFFQSLQVTPARREVFLHAAQIRAITGLRTPDALHLAFACCSRCDIFLTGDAQIHQRWGQLAGQYRYPSSIVVI